MAFFRELEQAKLALSRLQQMVRTIEPEEASASVRSTPVPPTSTKPTKTDNQPAASASNNRSSLAPSAPSAKANSILITNANVDVKMAAQHREIERLIESRQRLHTLKDQIVSLHQSVTTPPVPAKRGKRKEREVPRQRPSLINLDEPSATQAEKPLPKKSSAGPMNTFKLRKEDPIDLYRFDRDPENDEETDEDSGMIIPPSVICTHHFFISFR